MFWKLNQHCWTVNASNKSIVTHHSSVVVSLHLCSFGGQWLWAHCAYDAKYNQFEKWHCVYRISSKFICEIHARPHTFVFDFFFKLSAHIRSEPIWNMQRINGTLFGITSCKLPRYKWTSPKHSPKNRKQNCIWGKWTEYAIPMLRHELIEKIKSNGSAISYYYYAASDRPYVCHRIRCALVRTLRWHTRTPLRLNQ